MNKKAILAIVAVAVIIIGAGTGYALTKGKQSSSGNNAETTVSQSAASETQQTSAIEAQTEGKTEESTTQTVTESTTQTTAAATDYSFLSKSVWYYFDDENRCAWAFKFDGDDDVDIVYFSTDNIDGGDVKTASGEADYKIVDSKIIIDDIPSVIEKDSFSFNAGANELTDDKGNKLEAHDKAILDYAVTHFN